jgi:hypothetical protein
MKKIENFFSLKSSSSLLICCPFEEKRTWLKYCFQKITDNDLVFAHYEAFSSKDSTHLENINKVMEMRSTLTFEATQIILERLDSSIRKEREKIKDAEQVTRKNNSILSSFQKSLAKNDVVLVIDLDELNKFVKVEEMMKSFLSCVKEKENEEKGRVVFVCTDICCKLACLLNEIIYEPIIQKFYIETKINFKYQRFREEVLVCEFANKSDLLKEEEELKKKRILEEAKRREEEELKKKRILEEDKRRQKKLKKEEKQERIEVDKNGIEVKRISQIKQPKIAKEAKEPKEPKRKAKEPKEPKEPKEKAKEPKKKEDKQQPKIVFNKN